MKKRIVSSTFYAGLDYVVLAVTGYVFWMAMGRLLLPDYYGILTTVMAIYAAVVAVFSFNVVEVFGKFIPKYLAKKKESSIGSILKFLGALSMALILIFSVIAFLFAEPLAMTIYNDVKMIEGFQLLAIITIIGYFMTFSRGMLFGFQDWKRIFYADTIGHIFKILLSVALVLGGYVLGGIWGTAAGFGIVAIVQLLYMQKRKIAFGGAINKPDILRHSSSSIIFVLATFLIMQSGTILLGIMNDLFDVGLFGVALLFGQVMGLVPMIIYSGIFPSMSYLWSKGNKDYLSHLMNLSIKYSLIFTVPIIIAFYFFASDFISIIYRTEYAAAAGFVPFYMLGALFFGMLTIFLGLLYAINRPHLRSAIFVFGAALNLALTYVLIQSHGISGAVYAYLVSTILITTISLIFLLREGFTLWFPVRKFMVPLVVFTVLSYGVSLLDLSPFLILLAYIPMSLAYLYLLLIFRIFGENDLELVSTIRKFGFLRPVFRVLESLIKKNLSR